MIALVGYTNAGKSTLLKCLMGLIKPSDGHISLNGADVTRSSPAQMVRLGLALSPEGREVFSHLSVLENLQLGAIPLKLSKTESNMRIEEVFSRFPKLKERQQQLAGTLSGGEQQMLAIGRAMMSLPELLLIDELSLGLAPVVTRQIYQTLDNLGKDITILLVEQNVEQALKHSQRAYIMESGHITRSGNSSDLIKDEDIRRAYLGM